FASQNNNQYWKQQLIEAFKKNKDITNLEVSQRLNQDAQDVFLEPIFEFPNFPNQRGPLKRGRSIESTIQSHASQSKSSIYNTSRQELLTLYNPTHGQSEEKRVELTANRVGLKVPE
ncbi:33489_t:CDS:2, partial [Racocetra persica]